jgi:hypothetical protein
MAGLGPVFADIGQAWRELRSARGSTENYPKVIQSMTDSGLYFASVPYIKEYLATTSSSRGEQFDALVDKVVSHVGVKQFEVMPTQFLNRSKAPTVQYIVARKLFRKGEYDRAVQVLRGGIPSRHNVKPFALFLEASIYAIQGKNTEAVSAYNRCISASNSELSDAQEETRRRQLTINRDYCTVGTARAQFAAGIYDEANLSFLDLDKSSYIWPEILFEEAWNSFYLKDYNRTLGKLVTYKAPILDFIFNPEIDVLRALTYMELCLWQDSNKVVDKFYSAHERDFEGLKAFISKHGKDYRDYYLLAKSRRDGDIRGNKLINKVLHSIIRDPAYQELYDSFLKGRDELEIVKNLNIPNFKRILQINLKESMLLQRDLIGAYVKSQMDIYSQQINQAFIDMSYIKLEVLERKKTSLYDPGYNMNRGRGSIANLKRTDKQYFWNFNGEFWADELGDYVFSLKSECQ